MVSHVLAANAPLNVMDWNNIKGLIRDSLRDYLWREIKRSPMILPIIMEVKG